MKLRVLEDKQLLSAALKKSRRCIIQSEQLGVHALQLDVLDLEHKIIHQIGGLETDLKSEDSISTFDRSLELLRFQKDNIILKKLSVELLQYYRNRQMSDQGLPMSIDLSSLEKTYDYDIPTLNFVLDFRVYSCKFLNVCSQRDWPKAYEHSQRLIDLTGQYPEHQLSKYNYLSVVGNHISLGIAVEKTDDLDELVEKAELHGKRYPQFAASMIGLYTSQFTFYNSKKMFETILFHSERTVRFLRKYDLDSSILAAHIYCYIGAAELAKNNMKNLAKTSQMLSKRKYLMPENCHLFLAMIKAIVCLEEASVSKLKRHIKSTERREFYSDKSFLSEYFSTILQMINATPADRKSLAGQLLSESSTYSKDSAFEVFESYHLADWLRRYATV